MKAFSFSKNVVIVAVFMFLLLIGWSLWQHKAVHASQANLGPPTVPVVVETLIEKPVRTWSQFSGRMEAVDFAQIRPEVSGRIVKINFEDGQQVKAGDVLFIIDPRTYKAAKDKAQAQVISSQANLNYAKTELDRAAVLIQSNAISKTEYDAKASNYKVAKATVASAYAQLHSAEVDLDRAYVKAPISGRVSRPEITQGNLVNAGGNAPLLTSIVSNDGIYADFDVDEQTYLQSIHTSISSLEAEKKIPVELTLALDNGRIYKGTVYSFDNRIDPSSGTIRARAKFANEDGSLIPGMFVSVKLASSGLVKVLLVPEKAIGSDQSKKFVYIVDEQNKVVYRQVEVGQSIHGERIVIGGLRPKEKVIVDGIQHVMPGAVVQAQDKDTRNLKDLK